MLLRIPFVFIKLMPLCRPESLGLVTAALYLVTLFCFIPVRFGDFLSMSGESAAFSCTEVRICGFVVLSPRVFPRVSYLFLFSTSLRFL